MTLRTLALGSSAALTWILAASLLGGSPSLAQSTDSMGGGMSSAPASDADFAAYAKLTNTQEITEAKLALSKSKTPQVKAYAQRIIADHTAANTKLMPIAAKYHGAVPPNIASMAQDELQQLRSSSGTSFDSAYMSAAVPEQQNALQLLQYEAQHGKDAKLKAYANAQIPLITGQMKLAQAYDAAHGGGTAQ